MLALDPTGKLVVELNRPRAEETTDLQAIRSASQCTILTAVELQRDYREFWSGRFDRTEVVERFLDVLAEADEAPMSASSRLGTVLKIVGRGITRQVDGTVRGFRWLPRGTTIQFL